MFSNKYFMKEAYYHLNNRGYYSNLYISDYINIVDIISVWFGKENKIS